MKSGLWTLSLLAVAALAAAQSHAGSVRLALIVESPGAAAAADVLTVELSKKDGLQLLERAEIDKVYREQALSAGNKDYLKT